MSTIINATTTNGVVIQPDNSGSLVLQTNNGTTALTIDTSQNVAFAKGFTVGATAAPAFSAYTTTTQALTGAVTTKVNFGGEVFDTNSNFASSRFTPTVAGYYQLTTALVYNSATFTDLYIYKNGSVYQQIFGNYSSSTYYGSGTGLIYLNGTTDYAEIYVYSSGSLSITSSQQNCWFSGAMVRSA